MARIEFKNMAHSYVPNPQGPEDYALHRSEHVWEDGGAYALLGPSGCGKTTLLNITSGLLTPSEGQVLFDGDDVTKLRPEERNIAQVFQFPVIYDTMTVRGNLAFPLRNRGAPESHVKNRVEQVAEMLELTHMLDRKASGLGMDEKQKISMGRGLVRDDVRAILFDEPLTIIDPHLKWVLRRKLREIHSELKHTLIYVTHDQTEALTLADKVVVMEEGRVLQTGTPQDLFERPSHTFVGYFIGSPGMNFLSGSVEGESVRVGSTVLPLVPEIARKAASMDGEVTIGVRPERIQLAATADEGHCALPIKSIEDLGNYYMLHLDFEGHDIRVRAREDRRVTEGDTVGLVFPPEWNRVYCNKELVE